jgi:Ni,Fe-hydrogenase III large subunit
MIKGINKARTSTPWKAVRQSMVAGKHQSRKWLTLHKQLRNLMKERMEIMEESNQIISRLRELCFIPDDERDCD